jgi:DNA primase
MASISQEKIREILDKTDLVELINRTVSLEKKGKNYFGLCPFHSEKTPSFSVEPERKFYHCFSCGEKGDAITFLEKTKNLTFIEAVEQLASDAGVSLGESFAKKEDPNKRLYQIMQDAMQFYKLYLHNTKAGQKAKEYLNSRRLNEDLIAHFDIGLAPDEPDLLLKSLVDRGYLESDLYDLGLVKTTRNSQFVDSFKRRIMFPIKDLNGRVVGFSGRTYLAIDKDAPKYINSPQTQLFQKSNILYHFDYAKQVATRQNRVVLFEGYMDVIAAYNAGFGESVASMGTSITKNQVHSLSKVTKNVTICYDGDPAGIAATSRAINMFQQAKVDIRIVLIPEGLDPDDYSKKYGLDALKTLINEHWMDGIEFEYRKSNMSVDFTKMLDLERFKKTVFDLIKGTSHTIVETYLNRLSEDTGLSVDSIRQDFEQYTKKRVRSVYKRKRKELPIESKYERADRLILNYLLADYKYVQDFGREFNGMFYLSNIVLSIRMVIEDLYFNIPDGEPKVVSLKQVEEKLTEEEKKFLHEKVLYPPEIKLNQDEYVDFIRTLNEYLKTLQIEKWNEEIKVAPNMLEKIKLAEYRDLKLKEVKRWTKK